MALLFVIALGAFIGVSVASVVAFAWKDLSRDERQCTKCGLYHQGSWVPWCMFCRSWFAWRRDRP